jgi:hypothetical protein
VQAPSGSLGASLDLLLQAARARQELPNPLFDHAEITLPRVEEPTALVFWGDWHLGAAGTDYARFEYDVRQLAYARSLFGERLHIIGMGDFIDGYLPTGTPSNPTQLLSPKEQRLAAEEALELTRPSVVLEGDHDAWHSKQQLEYAWLHEATLRHGLRYAQWGTRVTIPLGNNPEPLVALVRHRYKGSRIGDTLKPQKNLHLELGRADIVALAHVHSNPGTTLLPAKRRSEGSFVAVQSGTYKRYDDYSKKLGHAESDYGVPAVLVLPNGAMSGFHNYQDALDELC